MTVVLIAAVVCGIVLALVWAGQRRLMYFPMGLPPAPAQAGLPGAEAIAFQTADGLSLQGWFLPPRAPARGAVLVFNGNGGNRAHRAMLARTLGADGHGVLLFDYRGYGGNPGSPSEAGLTADARAARAWLLRRSDVDPRQLVYFGESLGAAVAASLAVEAPPAALILRSPFTSMTDVAAVHYPFLPVRWLVRDRYDTAERITRLRCPLLVVAGSDDSIVPAGQSRRLFDQARVDKAILVLPGADHNDPALLAGGEMVGAVHAFIRRHAVLPAGAPAAAAGTSSPR